MELVLVFSHRLLEWCFRLEQEKREALARGSLCTHTAPLWRNPSWLGLGWQE